MREVEGGYEGLLIQDLLNFQHLLVFVDCASVSTVPSEEVKGFLPSLREFYIDREIGMYLTVKLHFGPIYLPTMH